MTSAEKVLVILELLSTPPFSLNLTEIAKRLNMTKTGAKKILSTMEERCFVIRDDQTKSYSLGHVLFRMGNVFAERKGISEVVAPILMNITDSTEETSYLSFWEREEAYMMLKRESPHGVFYPHYEYCPIPTHAGSTSKVLLAFQPETTVRQIVEKLDFRKIAPNSITDSNTLLDRLIRIREEGYDISYEEYQDNAIAMAVPIWGTNGKVWCALGVVGPKKRINPDKVEEIINMLKRHASEIARKMVLRK